MKNGRFRIVAWDHILLCGQIVSVQFSVYFFLSLLMLFFALTFGSKYSASFLFLYRVIKFSGSDGKLIITVFIINSFLSAVLLRCIVKRAKQCLDFSCTFHGLHLFICWWYNSEFPCNLSWWILNILTSAVMCIGGEILCLKSELENISLGYSALSEKSDV